MTKTLIIDSPYYTKVSTFLREGAEAVLKKENMNYDIISVPGALEIPAALNFSLDKNYGAYVVLGCIIRGETSHYDIVCNESARGIYALALAHNLALGNGILTVENMDQAIVRADPKQKNKGGDAAHAALEMLKIKISK